ncbi:unnamed protein product [Penicillium olsonii]|nr:unnamed protein product [Penicillium olsonii]
MDLNEAAWLPAKCAPLRVEQASFTAPSAHQIVVKNAAVAVNPVEWCKQLMGDILFSFIKYPFILGNDCAGTVAQVGDEVSRFKIGDRVLAHAIGMDPNVNKSAEGAFQKFTVICDNMASVIPEWMSFEEACVLPLGLSTAACALFQQDFLALDKPDVYNLSTLAAPDRPREVVIVWGGSSSVGSNAIQLAKAAGYEVIATASPKNFEYIHELGANEAFNYRSQTVVKDIIEALGDKKVAGAIAIGNGSVEACMDILARTRGKKFVVQVSFKFPTKIPSTGLEFVFAIAGLLWSNITIFLKSKITGVGTKMVFGSTLAHNEVGNLVYRDFLPGALEEKEYQAAPKPIIVGSGLESIQEALNRHMNRGASAAKYVVSI